MMEVGTPVRKFYLHTPSTITIVGSSGVGKTTFVERLAANWDAVVPGSKPVGQLVICYLHWQPAYDRIVHSLRQRFPICKVKSIYAWDEDFVGDEKSWDLPEGQQSLLILDDMFEHVAKSKAFQALFKNLSHHKRITVVRVFRRIYKSKFLVSCSGDVSLVVERLRLKGYSLQTQKAAVRFRTRPIFFSVRL